MNQLRQDVTEEIVKAEGQWLDLLKHQAKNNLFLFNRHVLQVDQGEGKVPLAPFHRQLCNFVQDSRDKKKLILVPRLHLKSTLVTIGYSLFRIVNDPNIRILILSGKHENAVDFVGAIKDHLTKNDLLKNVFGNLADNPLEWKTGRFTLRVNRTSLGEKEPTVMGSGITSNVVSKHFDLIILDDIVVRENTETIEQIDKVIKRYKDVIDLMDVSAELLMIGTRWTDADVYSWVLDPENHQKEQFEIFLRRAMEWEGPIETALTTGEGFQGSLWPEKFTREELLKRFKAKAIYEFSCQYLNNPVPDTEATFRKDWLHYYEETDIKGLGLNNYITVDPAISIEKEADYSAIVVTGVDQWGNVYVRDIVRERMLPDVLISTIFRKAEEWHPQKIGLEDVAYQKALGYTMKEEMRKRNRSLPVIPVKPGDRTKDQRIKGLQPLYADGKVFHRVGLPMLRYFEDELLRFPRSRHDDVIDALSYTLDLIVKPRKEKSYYHHKYLY